MNEKNEPASELPWSFVLGGDGTRTIRNADKQIMWTGDAGYYDQCPFHVEDWKYIVLAVNSHKQLVEALDILLTVSYEDGDTLIAARNLARSILRLANGE